MNTNRKPAALGKGQTGLITDSGNKSNTKQTRVKSGTKEHTILSALADGRSLNRFEAITLHDTALNSTISTLQGKGLRIHRKFEKVSCVNGKKT